MAKVGPRGGTNKGDGELDDGGVEDEREGEDDAVEVGDDEVDVEVAADDEDIAMPALAA